jgi:hypothetical protein
VLPAGRVALRTLTTEVALALAEERSRAGPDSTSGVPEKNPLTRGLVGLHSTHCLWGPGRFGCGEGLAARTEEETCLAAFLAIRPARR